jgi:hypothetical protein
MAPEVGLEPTTLRLTAECSAIELLRSVLEREIPTRCAFIVIANPDMWVKDIAMWVGHKVAFDAGAL